MRSPISKTSLLVHEPMKKMLSILEYLPLLIVAPKKGVHNLSRINGLVGAVCIYIIIGVTWAGLLIVKSKAVEVLEFKDLTIGLGAWIADPLFMGLVFYSLSKMIGKNPNVSNLLQIMFSIGIIGGLLFFPLYYVLGACRDKHWF